MNKSQAFSSSHTARFELKRWYENSAVLLLYTVLTAAMTYPAVLFLRTKVLGGPEDNFHFLWELWYVAHALFDLHKSPFFDPDVFVPFGFSLIRNQDLSPGTVLLFSPLTHFFGEVFTYNFLVLVSFPLTAFGTYLFARELWSNRLAALLAGIIVGFCPYRFAHAAGHLSIVATQWIPFFFFYLERLISRPRLRNAVLTGVFFGLSAWTTWYYFFMVPIAAIAYVAFRVNWRLPAADLWHLLKLGLAAAGVALIFVLPFLIPYYLATHGGVVDYRGAGESQAFAAALADYIIPPTSHFWWGPAVDRLWRQGPNGLWQSEWQLYLGAIALVLAAAGVFHPRRRVVAALISMALVCLVFSLGPGLYVTHPPTLNGNTNDVPLSPIPMPGRLLRQLPGFNNLRGWARLGFFVELSVGVLAAAGLTRVLDWTRERFQVSTAVQTGIAAVTIAAVIFDFFPQPAGMTVVAPRAVDQWLSRQPGDFAFIEYPIPRHGFGGPAIYSTRLTGKSIIMGSSQNPPNLAYWSDLSALPSPFTIDLLHGWGTKYVLVDQNLYQDGSIFWNIYQTWDTLLSAIKQNPQLKEVTVLDTVHVYEIVTGTHNDSVELLKNGSFEEGGSQSLPGWKMAGKPTVDRTSKYSYGGRTGCRVTAKDFLFSQPVRVDSGRCYRLSIRAKAGSDLATLVMQLNWKDDHNNDVDAPSRVRVRAWAARRWEHPSLTVRAPAEAKSVVVQAKAADGNIWIDDYSLKSIRSECEPGLFVTPNPLYSVDGQIGRVAVSWNTCCSSEGRVTLTKSNGVEEVFSRGSSGLAFLDGIKPGAQYEFRLYSEQGSTVLQSVNVSTRERTPTIAADPNPVPTGAGLGRTTISWTTLAKDVAEVYVSKDGGPEQLFARGPYGSIEAGWIATGSSYEFRLYSGDASRRLLAKTIVKR
jgi:hypothetical protein